MRTRSLLPLMLYVVNGWCGGSSTCGDTAVAVSEALRESFGVIEAEPDWGDLPEETIDDINEQADYLRSHPYDLNSVSQEELESIPGVRPEDGRRIIELRSRLKRFESPLQLLQLAEEGERLYYRVSPSVVVREPSVSARVRTRVLTRAEDAAGPASPLDILQEVILRGGQGVSFDGLYHKAAAERFEDGFLTSSILLSSQSLRASVLLGDFVIESGQGLLFWRSRSSGKGVGSVQGVRKVGRGALPYHSVSESGFLRGIAVSAAPDPAGRLFVQLFASRRPEGYTTNGVKSTRNAAGGARGSERLLGGFVRWSVTEQALVTLSGSRVWYEYPLLLEQSPVDTLKTVRMMSASLLSSWARFQLFSEFAVSDPGSHAVVVGIRCSALRPLACVVLWREYRPSFFSPCAGGFGETVDTRNERGFYVGWEIEQAGRFSFEGSIDKFGALSPRGSARTRLGGSTMIVRTGLRFTESIRVNVLCTRSRSDWYRAQEGGPAVFCDDRQTRIGCSLEIAPFRGGRFATDVETTIERREGGGQRSSGIVLSEEVRYRLWPGVECMARLAYFDLRQGVALQSVDGDIPGFLTRSVLEGKGRRWSLSVYWRPLGWGTINVKVSGRDDVRGVTLSSGRVRFAERWETALSLQAELAF